MTVLFLKDYAKYPGCIVDTQTKNKSFVRLAAVYRSMGIKNHAFILILLDPTLQGVDPHDPNLTIEQIARIVVESKRNFWYFVREVLRAPAIGGNETTYVEANRGNIAAWWLFFNHILFTLIQPRQTGKSFSINGLMRWMMDVGCLNTKINLLTKNDNLRRKNVRDLKEMGDTLPYYFIHQGPDDAKNTEEITVKALGNYYETHVPQSSPKRADLLGRGLTTSIIHIDEAPFQTHIKIALDAALPAMTAAMNKSKEAGAPYGVIMTTTAGKKDDRDGKYIYKIVSESAIWSERFLDAIDAEDLEGMIRRNARSGAPRINLTFNHRQLGKTDRWMMDVLEATMLTGEAANRDLFCQWTSGSQSHPLPIHILDKITNSIKDVVYTEVSGTNGYLIRWYIEEDEIPSRMATGKYILGMDTSEAGGGDDISLVIIDVETLEVLACGTFNETNLITFSHWVTGIFVRFPNITGVIERRSTGGMLLDYLLVYLPQAGIDPFKRLFNTVVHDYEEDPERYQEIKIPMNRRDPNVYVKFKKCFGYATSGSGMMSRSNLYSTALNMAGKKAADVVHDKSLIDQINGLITKNGRIDHQDGEHDDMVIGWLLCIWFITQGKNLSHYGIDSKLLMSRLFSEYNEDPELVAFKEQQKALRAKMTEISDYIAQCKDDYVSMCYERELRLLANKIVYEEGEIISVDELVRQAKEKRRFKRDHRLSNNSYQNNIYSDVNYSNITRR